MLKNLNLASTNIGTEGGIAIAKALSVNGVLTNLNLAHNIIKDHCQPPGEVNESHPEFSAPEHLSLCSSQMACMKSRAELSYIEIYISYKIYDQLKSNRL